MKKEKPAKAHELFAVSLADELAAVTPALSKKDKAKQAQDRWKALSAEQKAPFEAEAKAQLDAYELEHGPSKPMTPFMVFSALKRAQTTDSLQAADLGAMWKAATPEEKQPLEEDFERRTGEYKAKLQAFKDSKKEKAALEGDVEEKAALEGAEKPALGGDAAEVTAASLGEEVKEEGDVEMGLPDSQGTESEDNEAQASAPPASQSDNEDVFKTQEQDNDEEDECAPECTPTASEEQDCDVKQAQEQEKHAHVMAEQQAAAEVDSMMG